MIKSLRNVNGHGYKLKRGNENNGEKLLEVQLELEQVKATLQSIGDGVIATDLNGNILFSNKATEELTGWNSSEIKGKLLSEIFSIKTYRTNKTVDNFFALALEKKSTIGLNNNSVLVLKNGEERFVSASIAPVLDTDENSTGIVVTFRDINRIKKLEESVKNLYQAVEQSANTVIITDRDGKIEYVNPKFFETTGYRQSEVIGKSPSILKSGKQNEDVYKVLWETITAGKHWNGEFNNKRKNGELYWELASISPVKNAEGVITHFIGTKEEITIRKKMEEELKRNKEIAETANKFKSEFLANMSHEIRTPLNGIKGMIDLTLLMELPPEQRENLKIANTCVESLMNVINDILDFSKIEAGKMRIENLQFNVRKFLDRILKPHSICANEKMLTFAFSIEEDVPQILVGDSNRVAQILNNLIGNAIKFTELGEVGLHVEAVKKENDENIILKFIVSDTGIGIEKEKIELLFKSFSQVDGTITRRYGGTGLGLAISKKLAELMDGTINVESEENKGSTFCFTALFGFKDKIEEDFDLSKNNKQLAIENKDKILRILLVEDNEMNQIVTSSLLKKKGQIVEIANNGKEAVELAKQKFFDVILMDIQMPEMDGIEATKMIRFNEESTGRHTPIVALTAYALQGDKEKFLKAGMDGYVSKPIQIKEFFRAIENSIQSNEIAIDLNVSGKKELTGYNSTNILSSKAIEDFLKVMPAYIEKLKEEIDCEKYDRIEIYAHFVKEICYKMDLEFMKNLAFKIEMAARKEKIEEIKITFDQLSGDFSIIKTEWSNNKK